MALRGMDVEGAQALSERVLELIRSTPFIVETDSIHLTVSIGVASMRHDDMVLDDLLRRADRALYAAKERGRDRVSVA